MNYKVKRIGLINFWLYDEETFDFEDGKLLLRGSNGSGKSVTMQSFIPLILDGNKNPSRLDPFGSKDKRIEDYLLGNADGEQKDEAIGYLFMELYSEQEKRYRTLGMGLHAKKGRPTDFWGFILKDGRRVGQDFLLYHSQADKVPCTKRELRARLGNDNVYVESAKEYKEAVNKNIFGFPDLDMYDEFINLLLQLRSPKLSKEYKPTKLMEILSTVLQPLTEEDLRPLSEAIEEMDKTKENIIKLQSHAKQLSNLLITYNNYNETMLYRKAKKYLDNLHTELTSKENLEQLEKEIEHLEESIHKNEKRTQELQSRKEICETKRSNLNSTDLESKIHRFKIINDEIKEENRRKMDEENRLKRYLDKITELEQNLKGKEENKNKEILKSHDLFKEIENLCIDIKFDEGIVMLKEYDDPNTLKQFAPLKIRLHNYRIKLEQIKQELEKKQQLEEKRNEFEEQINVKNKDYEEITQNIQGQEEAIADEVSNIKEQISSLGKTNSIARLTVDEVKAIIEPFAFYDQDSYTESKQKYIDLISKIKEKLTNEFYRIQNKKANQSQKITELKKMLDELQESKEIEIIRDEEEKKTISILEEKNISYIELYKAIEFKGSISKQDRNKLESTLLATGLLNAFIVSDLSKVNDLKGNFITIGPKAKNNLTEYFQPAIESHSSIIKQVLESISTNQKHEICLTKDFFQINHLRFQGSDQIQSVYIGLLARQKAKEEKIEQVKKQLEDEEAILQNLNHLKQAKEDEITQLESESKAFPSDKTLVQLETSLLKLHTKLDVIHKDKVLLEEKLQILTNDIETLFKRLVELKKEVSLPLYLETFHEVIEKLQYLASLLSNFENCLKEIQRIKSTIGDLENQKKDYSEQVEQLHSNLTKITLSLKRKEQEKEDLNQILNSREYKDLSNQIQNLGQEIDRIEEELTSLRISYGKETEALSRNKNSLEDITQSYQVKCTLTSLAEDFFKEEYNLHYVEDQPYEHPKELAKKMVKKLSSRKDIDVNTATNNYYEAFNRYRMPLSDYHLTSSVIFEHEIKEIPELDKELLFSIYSENTRSDFKAIYQGKPLNLYALLDTLKDAIDENNQLISEQDRHLFEEILLKTVGSKIRDRINSSKAWVKEINEIMKEMQKNSSLSFGLEWRSKNAESMEELETKELVKIFKMDPETVQDEDSNRLISHFRSKLRKEIEFNNASDAYSSVIFDVLDYRNWFEFKMTYQRSGENKRELTNKVFSVFSGGEKAKTMYIPLFAAVSAKLKSANSNAPRMIVLDEAFAGVDDVNIREMFGILSSLNLDYILTSQALWGDYDTVKDLAISELIRPNNAQAVCVRRYRWNGKYKEIVEKKELEDGIAIF